jgi:hypothetical protein
VGTLVEGERRLIKFGRLEFMTKHEHTEMDVEFSTPTLFPAMTCMSQRIHSTVDIGQQRRRLGHLWKSRDSELNPKHRHAGFDI